MIGSFEGEMVERHAETQPAPALPRETLASAEALVDALQAAAVAHGLDPDGTTPVPRPALVHTARTLLCLLLPERPEPCPRQAADTLVALEQCSATPAVVVEAYSPRDGRLHGSLDQARYACPDHVGAVVGAVQAAGMAAYRTNGRVRGRVCGDVFDYTVRRGDAR